MTFFIFDISKDLESTLVPGCDKYLRDVTEQLELSMIDYEKEMRNTLQVPTVKGQCPRNFLYLVGRVSRTGFPDIFCLLIICDEYFVIRTKKKLLFLLTLWTIFINLLEFWREAKFSTFKYFGFD